MIMRRKRNVTDRILFNGHDLGKYLSCKVKRPIMAPVEVAHVAIPGRDGEVFKSVRRAGYTLPVEVALRSNWRREVAEVRHSLAEILWVDEPAPLYLPDDPDLYLMAVVSGDTDLGIISDECPRTTIEFWIGDPVYYGRKRKVQVPMATALRVDVGGSAPARPTFRLVATGDGRPRVTNVTTGEYVEVSASVSAGDEVVIDCSLEKATVNGDVAAVSLYSDFFPVSDRPELLVANASGTMEWIERWL